MLPQIGTRGLEQMLATDEYAVYQTLKNSGNIVDAGYWPQARKQR
ncbi:hypothetical protein [Citrobacter youngae]|uniref:Uncharacterized protein n=1 Tax=Citrobacter youngae ATCC 29220 TaxID=500640 RepID=D4BDZ8_9ENTR|nr:hypothetical protein [Citrobacter youngae]EFE08197.1 hypothetical protein CIT292_08717 [Citrobacter youngae ATCC 29220]